MQARQALLPRLEKDEQPGGDAGEGQSLCGVIGLRRVLVANGVTKRRSSGVRRGVETDLVSWNCHEVIDVAKRQGEPFGDLQVRWCLPGCILY